MANLQVGVAGNGTVTVGAGASVHSPASNTLTLGTNNTERLRINSSGNMGLGDLSNVSDNPQVLLHIASSSPTLRIQDTTNDFYGHISADDGGSLSFDSDAGNGAGSSKLVFKTDGSEHVRIDSSGNVGIGTDTPGHPLHVRNTSAAIVQVQATNTNTSSIVQLLGKNSSGTVRTAKLAYDNADQVRLITPDAIPLCFLTQNSERLRIDSAGDLGLGVAPNNFSSYRTLHIKGPSSGNGSAIRLEDHGDTADSDDFVIYKNSIAGYLRVNGTDPIIAYLNGGERIRIASAGQIGIGGANYGTSGQVLTSGGASAAPSWAAAGGGKLKGWAYGTTPSGTTGGATSSNKITLFTQAYTPTDANSTIIIYCWVNIDARTSSYSDRIRIQGVRDSTAQGARWLIHGSFGNSNGSILSLPYFYKPTGWTAGSSSTFKVELWSEGSSGTPSDQYNTRLHESGYYLLVELGS